MRALLVEDGQSRGALAAARALRKAGWDVGVAAPESQGLASWSRTVKWRHRAAAVSTSPDRFIADVARAVSEGSYDIVFPCGDAEVFALSAGRSQIDSVVPYAGHDVVMHSFDKLELADAASECGLAVPWTAVATDEALAGSHLPAIVKARLHSPPGGNSARLEVGVAHDAEEARRLIVSIRAAGGEPLIQEMVEGELCALTLLLDQEGVVLGEVQQTAHGTWPRGAGASVRAITEPVSEPTRAAAVKLLTSIGWFGLAELQFIRPPSGEPRLIDLNGRFYGSLALAVRAGVNLPALWAGAAMERGSSRQSEGNGGAAFSSARPGVRYQWLEGDLRRSLQSGAPVGQIMSCIRYSFGAAHSIWSTRDPWPGLRHAARLGLSAARRDRS